MVSLRLGLALASALLAVAAEGARKNGFELEGALVPEGEIRRGGPPRDGIQAIYRPRFVAGSEQTFLDESDRVLGLTLGGIAKAFPVVILEHHEVVNDWTQQTHMVVTYCPLCGSGMAFRSGADGRAVFGVSGLLYNSDVLLYDHATESLWSQILGRAVTGPSRGKRLQSIPVVHTTWSDWLRREPQTYVLSRETGYRDIDYRRGPPAYRHYPSSRRIWFPVANTDDRFHPKALVLGLELEGEARAYPFDELARTSGAVSDKVGGVPVVIRYRAAEQAAWAEDPMGQLLPAVRLYWFAWAGFYPDTGVFTAPD